MSSVSSSGMVTVKNPSDPLYAESTTFIDLNDTEKATSPPLSAEGTTCIDLDDTDKAPESPSPHEVAGEPGNQFMPHTKATRLVIISCMSIFCIASAASHTLLAQPFKRDLGIVNWQIPFVHSLVTAGSFPTAFCFWLIITKGKINLPSLKSWRSFALLGVPDALNIVSGAHGLNVLNATEYAIIRGTSLIFVVLFSKILTKKQFNLWQYLAVGMMATALALIGIKPASRNVVQSSGYDHIIGLVMAISGSIFVSILAVMTQKLFADEQRKGDLEFICQINTCQCIFTFIFILPFALLSEEFRRLPADFAQVSATGHRSSFFLYLLLMNLASPLMLFTNIGLTSFSSATFARSLGGPKRLTCMVLGVYFFNDEINMFVITAAALLLSSLCVYIYGGHKLQQSKQQQVTK